MDNSNELVGNTLDSATGAAIPLVSESSKKVNFETRAVGLFIQ